MEKTEKKETKKVKEEKVSCADQFCPRHGSRPIKLRGRNFEGKVIRKFKGRVTIEFERILKVRKYERYEKRRTKLHARLPDCMENEINIGDLIEITECRPISKTIHFFVVGKVKTKDKGEGK